MRARRRDDTHTVEATGRAPRVAMLLAGIDPPDRAERTAAGERPCNDVSVLTTSFDADVYDYGWLERWRGSSRLRGWFLALAEKTDQMSAALALAVMPVLGSYDAVYASGEDIGVPVCALSRLRRGRGPRFVVRFERSGYGRTAVRRRIFHGALRLAAQRMAVALCRTDGVADTLRTCLSTPPGRVEWLGQEIDTHYFVPDAPRSRDGSAEGAYIVSAGLEHRDYATLLRAVDELPVRLVIAAGSPWSKDGFDVDVDLPPNAEVGSFDSRRMRDLYRDAALVVVSVHPTDRACGMNVVGEGWAMQRPVVASATSGLSEFITTNETGSLVPPEDPEALRKAIQTLLAAPDVADRLGANGRRYVVENLSLDRFEDVVRHGLTAPTA